MREKTTEELEQAGFAIADRLAGAIGSKGEDPFAVMVALALIAAGTITEGVPPEGQQDSLAAFFALVAAYMVQGASR